MDLLQRITELSPDALRNIVAVHQASRPRTFTANAGDAIMQENVLNGNVRAIGQVPGVQKGDDLDRFTQTIIDESGNPKVVRFGVNADTGEKVWQTEIGPPWAKGGDGSGIRPYSTFIGYNRQQEPIVFNSRTEEFSIGNMPEGGPTVGRQFVELPESAQQSFTYGFQGLDQL